jgi:hypothetical protein
MRSAAPFLSILALIAMNGATPDASQSSDPAGKLGLWAGRWNYAGQIYGTAYSRAHSDSGTADCNWSPNRGYMVCDYFSTDPPHDTLSILSYDPATKTYTHVSVDKNSEPSRDTVTRSGDTWTASSEIHDAGKMLVQRTIFVFLSPDKQETTVEISANNGRSWTKMIQVTAVRVANAD